MRPTTEQIELAAYHRWLRRSGEHGRDHDDWLSAERDLRYALNYRTVVRHALEGPSRVLGDLARRKCRFCEQMSPRATFPSPPPPIFSPSFGPSTLLAADECDACRAQFREQLETPFEAFARPFLASFARGESATSIPVAAFKALVKLALAILPEGELSAVEDAIEWVGNPNHHQDFGVIRGLVCRVYRPTTPIEVPWTSVARRIEDEAPYPAMLFFVSTRAAVFQVPVPLVLQDDEGDGIAVQVPASCTEAASGLQEGASPYLDLPIARPS